MNIKILLRLFFLLGYQLIFSQNDCINTLIICGDGNYTGLSANGAGVQELSQINSCSSQENNSIWLKVTIQTGGTLGFILTPENHALVVDFDFFIFGPNASCTNLGTSIRCSTTNPLAANSTSNSTGMNQSETDLSEGPGSNGNNFIHWLDVLANETYFLVIDRPAGDGNFSIKWTGSAKLFQPPYFNTTFLDLFQCDRSTNSNGTATFDLTSVTNTAIGNQANVNATFFTTLNDAVTNENQIQNTSSYQNTSNHQTIFIRITNSITGCFETSSFTLNVYETPTIHDFKIVVEDLSDANTVSVELTSSTTHSDFEYSLESPTFFQNNPVFSNVYPGIYYLYIHEKKDCATIGPIKVNVLGLPKFFTPNQDGYNDTWKLEGIDTTLYQNSQISIFDRYGKLIKTLSVQGNGWDGTYNGVPAPSDDYWYVLKLNENRTTKGHFCLKR